MRVSESSIQLENRCPGLFMTARPMTKRSARGMKSHNKSSPGKYSILQASSGVALRRVLSPERARLMMARPMRCRSLNTRTMIQPVARIGITAAIPARKGLRAILIRGCLESRACPRGSSDMVILNQ